jgi:hypothetical protein
MRRKRKPIIPAPIQLPTFLLQENPWRSEGLFSAHFFEEWLLSSGSDLCPAQTESDAIYDKMKRLLSSVLVGIRKGNEEDCENRFINPALQLLGFGYSNRRSISQGIQRMVPDYLLYASKEAADTAFQQGTREAYYADSIAILEAKRWGHNLSEDASGKGSAPRGRSPHYQIRDYLSESDRLVWGILTNGSRWRLYCKKDRASSFFEFNLESVLLQNTNPEDDERARNMFRVFYALFRRDAFLREPNGYCFLDRIREKAQQFKEDVERDLRIQVFKCVEKLGYGFLENPQNHLTQDDLPLIYDNTLILLYRILFVLNAEARGLLPTRFDKNQSHKYYYSYSIDHIRRKLPDKETSLEYSDNATFLLYTRLRSLFALINGQIALNTQSDKNDELNVPRYNGGLFDSSQHPFLEEKKVADSYLSYVLKMLCYRESKEDAVIAIDYAGLGERHLGSIYEGLLEHHFTYTDKTLRLANDKGERKALGAYYTPDEWVAYIVESTLEPLLKRAESRMTHLTPTDDGEVIPDDSFAHEVLKLKICDPAMGSGHFLVAATSCLAESIAAHPTTAPRARLNADGSPRLKSDGSGEPLYTQDAKLAYWKRRVVESCIYGVDCNPLAVELTKLSLWLKTVDRVPLNFLDHHLRCGNSLLGSNVADLFHYRDPKKNTRTNGKKEDQIANLFTQGLADALRQTIANIHAIEDVDTDTHNAVKKKEQLWKEISDSIMPRFRAIGDLWISPWLGEKIDYALYEDAFDNPDRALELRKSLPTGFDNWRPFHWELEFPDIFFDENGMPKPNAGFDAVIGNPPWERIKLQENEFFAGRSNDIALAPKAADRKRLITELKASNPNLWTEYETARNRAELEMNFLQRSGFYPLMGRGDTNLYAVFAEKALQLIHLTGRVGLLVPSGIATDDTTRHYFQHIVRSKMLAELLDFENRDSVFADVDRRFKFSIIRMTGPNEPQDEIRCGFYMHSVRQTSEPDRVFPLKSEDFRLFNPNSLTCPIFRRRRDYELTRRIYENVPVLIHDARGANPGEAGNPWGIRFKTLFHMSNDSKQFRTAAQLDMDGFWRGAGNVYTKGDTRYVPLYEGKMVQMYDHRAASIVVNPTNVHRPAQEEPTSPHQYADPDYSPMPQFWVNESEVRKCLNGNSSHWLIGFKSITSPTNARSFICSLLPLCGVGNSMPVIILANEEQRKIVGCLIANLSSFVLDFAARQKIGGQNLNFFIVEQFPVLPPDHYSKEWHEMRLSDFILPRVLELCYTSNDMKDYAADMGYGGPPFAWDEERRFHLRCQLDAFYFLLYSLTREEAAEIMDTFSSLKRQEEARFGGRFRTKDMILGYMNAYNAGNMDALVKE